MLNRRKSKESLLGQARSNGSEFVRTLQLIGYPRANDLHGEDFDWLYENRESEHFLKWFCHNLDEDNLLSDQTIGEYKALQASGQTILEGEALEQALQTCQGPMNRSESQEEWSLKSLEEEAQRVQSLKSHKLHCLNKLQARAMMQQHQACRLSVAEEDCVQELRLVQSDLRADNAKQNYALLQTREAVEELACWHSDGCTEKWPPPFISGMGLSQYDRLEESCMKSLVEYTKVVLPQTEGANPPVSLEEGEGEEEEEEEAAAAATGVLESSTAKSKESLQQELYRLQLGHVCRLWEWCTTQAAYGSTMAGLQWAEKVSGSCVGQLPDTAEQAFWKVSGLREKLLALKEDVEQLKTERLPPLVQASAYTSCLPILLGDLDMDDVRLQFLSSKLQEVADQLSRQRARQDVLTLALAVELHDHSQTASVLEELQLDLRAQVSGQQERLAWMGNPNISSQWTPRVRIDIKDHTAIRLWELLDDPTSQRQLFRKYESLERRGASLSQKLRSLQVNLWEPLSQMPALESDFEELYGQMYDSKHLLVKPPELYESMDSLIAAVSQLDQMLQGFLGNIRGKRKALACPYQRGERDLHVHFFQDPGRLLQQVEELEQRVLAFSEQPV